MSSIHTSVLRESHPYTRRKVPWKLDAFPGMRLFHYIAGGGSRQFGRSVDQDEREYRQGRFLIKVAIFSILWLWFYLF
ncbi:MAG: hypothetical protein MJ109_01895 [Kiritimatiellae bacterium]|nr:hypothetical protein [Kiritimatiellia bacterium]